MLKKFKKLMFSPLVLSAIVLAALIIKPASLLDFYQPAPPQK